MNIFDLEVLNSFSINLSSLLEDVSFHCLANSERVAKNEMKLAVRQDYWSKGRERERYSGKNLKAKIKSGRGQRQEVVWPFVVPSSLTNALSSDFHI